SYLGTLRRGRGSTTTAAGRNRTRGRGDSRPLLAGKDHLERVHDPVILADGDVFARHEPLVLEPEAVLVVAIRRVVVVEAPAAARPVHDLAAPLLTIRSELAHAAHRPVPPPRFGVDVAVERERQVEMVAAVAITVRVARLAGELEEDVRDHVGLFGDVLRYLK